MYKLNTPPNILDTMFWYDIQLIYKRFAQHMEDEQKAQEEEYSIQQEQMERYQNEYKSQKFDNLPSMPSMPNVPSMDSFSRGFNQSFNGIGL